MTNIKLLYTLVPDRNLPIRQIEEQTSFGQNDALFHLAAAKGARITLLRQQFAISGIGTVFLSANLASFQCQLAGFSIRYLEKDFFLEPDSKRREEKKARIAGGIVIVNNNDVGTLEAREAYSEFFDACDTTCFVVWDWDNHHWLDLSTFLAAHSDIYAPAHHENLYILSRYNWLVAGPVYCSSVQWPRCFLQEHLPEMLTAERSPMPLGMHIPYTKFNFRIRVASTLHQRYPTIGFSNRTFHVRTAEDRLREWYSHKTHWIIPVLNDVPIRIFDALATGGIPIVPASLRLLPPIKSIPREHIAFYSPADIVDPESLVKYANDLFDRGGEAGMTARHYFALEWCHGEHSVRQMLGYAADVLGIAVP